ncbi:ureidoglycolate lyase [soil metagenome]
MKLEELDVVRIPVSPLTEEAFRPFGELLSAGERDPDFTGISSVGWRSSFASDSPPEVMFYRSSYSGMRFSKLERHHAVTQSFVPLGRTPSVVAVAAPTSANRAPEPGDVRAFLLDGTAGYALKAGTWHSLDRYPLFQAPADIVIITDRLTQQELESSPAGPWTRTEAVDYAERFGVVFEFEL